MSKHDDDIIAQYFAPNGKSAELFRWLAATSNGIDRVEDGEFVFGDGTTMPIEGKSMIECWAEESKILDKLPREAYMTIE